MTLLVAVSNVNTVVIGADSRQLHDDPSVPGLFVPEDGIRKIGRLTDRVLFGLQGRSEYAPDILRRMRDALAAGDDVEAAYEACADCARDLYKKWFWGIEVAKRPETNILLAGMAERDGRLEPRILFAESRQNFAREEFEEGRAAFGRWGTARPLLNQLHSIDLPRDVLVGLVAYVLVEAIATDVVLGKPIHIAEVSTESGHRELSSEGVCHLLAEVERRRATAREILLNPDWESLCKARWQPGDVPTSR